MKVAGSGRESSGLAVRFYYVTSVLHKRWKWSRVVTSSYSQGTSGGGGSQGNALRGDPAYLCPLHTEPHQLRCGRGGRCREGGMGTPASADPGPRPRRKSRGDPAAQFCRCLRAKALASVASWELSSVWPFSGETGNPLFLLNLPQFKYHKQFGDFY